MEHPSDFHRLLRKGDRRRGAVRRLPGEAVAPSRSGRPAARWRVGRHTWLNVVVAGALIGGIAPSLLAEAAAPGAGMTSAGVRLGYCHSGGGTNCVVDGDTFWIGGEKVRIADIDTPETHPPRCEEERRLGFAAGARLQELLNAGPVTLVANGRDTDRYGRLLRRVERDGASLGDVLVSEGLARPYAGGRRPWCGADVQGLSAFNEQLHPFG